MSSSMSQWVSFLIPKTSITRELKVEEISYPPVAKYYISKRKKLLVLGFLVLQLINEKCSKLENKSNHQVNAKVLNGYS